MDCSPPGSSVHGISRARILEWVAVFFFREYSPPRDRTSVSYVNRWVLYPWAAREALFPLAVPPTGPLGHTYSTLVTSCLLTTAILTGVRWYLFVFNSWHINYNMFWCGSLLVYLEFSRLPWSECLLPSRKFQVTEKGLLSLSEGIFFPLGG